MTFLSALRKFQWRRTAQGGVSPMRDERTARRFDVRVPVLVGPPGGSPSSGIVINLSVGGAAIQIDGGNPYIPPDWSVRLNHGDEILIDGLLDTNLLCWVVTFDDGILRVHFEPDDALRDRLRSLIRTLTTE